MYAKCVKKTWKASNDRTSKQCRWSLVLQFCAIRFFWLETVVCMHRIRSRALPCISVSLFSRFSLCMQSLLSLLCLFLCAGYRCVLVIAVSCLVSFSILFFSYLKGEIHGRGACGACSLSHWLRSVVPLMTLYTQRGECKNENESIRSSLLIPP